MDSFHYKLEGAYIRGVEGGFLSDVFFGSQLDGPITYKQQFTYLKNSNNKKDHRSCNGN